jgi:pimeloyl-ACP methyl ester carboxylesterase
VKTTIKYGGGVLIAGAVLLGAFTVARYRRDMRAARERVISGGSQVVETDCGPIEYATRGEGPPVLAIHGAGGGYDQGLLLADMALADGFQVIAPSRFGYLGTPLRADNSPAAQADAHACLLDALDIDRVTVVGLSAGGPSALQFALRYPDRTAALVMVSAVSPLPSLPESRSDAIITSIYGTDFGYWLMTTAGRKQLVWVLGVTPEVQAALSPEDDAIIDAALEGMLPVSPRRDGIYEDMAADKYLTTGFPLEQISAPTLVTHAIDDMLVEYAYGEYTAEQIPGAQLLTLESGGHMSAGQQEKLEAEVSAFLNRYVAPESLGWEAS